MTVSLPDIILESHSSSPCETCPIEEKIARCCGKYPPTAERAPLVIAGGVTLMACPHLTAGGLCDSYNERPQGCRIYTCPGYEHHPWKE